MEEQHLSVAFTVWAAVVALAGGWIAIELRQLRGKLDKFFLNVHGRLTAVETHLHIKDGFRSFHIGEEKNE